MNKKELLERIAALEAKLAGAEMPHNTPAVLGNIHDLRRALGPRVSAAYASALKSAAGFKHRKIFPIQAVIDWAVNPANADFMQSTGWKQSRQRTARSPGRLAA
jgi:hypothetical protein